MPSPMTTPHRRPGEAGGLSRRQPLLLSMVQFRLDHLEVAVEMPFGDVTGGPLGNVPLVGSTSAATWFECIIWVMAAFH
jgi:hypothetical protein